VIRITATTINDIASFLFHMPASNYTAIFLL
jgi:hypothetical protein